MTRLGDESADRSSGAFRYPDKHTMWLPALSAGGGWALYSFAELADGDMPAVVEIELAGDLPAQYWAGFSDYALEAWRWVEVEPEGTNYIDVRSLGQPVSAGGAFHVVVVADAEIPTEIAQLTLYSNLPPPPPTHVEAEPQWQPGHYMLSWAKAETATGYQIFRDSKEEVFATAGDVDAWTDTTIYAQDYTYWVKAVNEHGASGFSQPAYGRAGAWQLQRIDPWGRKGTSLAVVDGKPVIAYVAIVLKEDDEATPYPRFARATTSTPLSPDDWVITEWNEWGEAVNGTSPPWLAVLDGKPAFTISKRYYRALTPAPSGRDDWEMHHFDEDASVKSAAPLVELSGYPYIAYVDSHVDVLRLARGLTTAPASENDWDNTAIVGFGVMNPNDISLTAISGLPAVSYDHRLEIGESGDLYFALATAANPASSSDWQRQIVDDIPFYPAGASKAELISLTDGKPAISYVEDYPGYTGLKFARSYVAAPSSPADWVTHTVLANSEYSGIHTSMWLVDGKPVICYYDGEGIEYATANVPEPTSTDDWTIASIYVGEVRNNMCLRVINGQPQISFCTTDGLYLLTHWD